MTLVVTHPFVSLIADGPNPNLVRPSNWNDNHTLTGFASPPQGGTGVANSASNTLTWSGAFAVTFTLTGTTSVTFPTSGTLATTANLGFVAISPSGDVTGVTDSAAIVAAQATAVTNKATAVLLDLGNWYLATSVTLPSGICINGKGNAYGGTAASGGTIVNMVGNVPAFQVSGTLTPVINWCLNNLSVVLPASGTSATGLTLDAGQYGYSRNVTIYVVGPSQIGVLSNPGAAHANTAWNTFINLVVSLGGAATSGAGIKLTGQSAGPNSSQNTFIATDIITSLASHTALWLAASDTNHFYGLSMLGNVSSAWTAIKFDYSVQAAWPSQTYFYGLEYGYNNSAGASAVVNTGSPSGGSLAANIIYGLGTTNGNAVPNIANLYVIGTNAGSLSNGILSGATTIPAGSSLAVTAGTLSVGGAFGANTSVLWDAGSGKGYEWSLNGAAGMRLYPSGGFFLGASSTADPGANNFAALGTIKTGVTGAATGQIIFGGATSGTATITAQAANGSPTVTLGTSSGTPAVTASSPLAIATATGNITCATCVTTSSTLNLVVGTTTISSGTTLRVLYDNAGVLGEYTNTQLTALINVATTALSGALPAWPNNTTTFFRGDGTYAAAVTSVATTSPITGGTITGTGTIACATCVTSAASLTANSLMIGSGSQASAVTTTGTGVLTALGNNVGSAGAFVTFNGPLGSPSSAGTMPAFTLGGTVSGGGNQINNVIIGTTTPLAGFFATLQATSMSAAAGKIGFGTETSPQTPFVFSANATTGTPDAGTAVVRVIGTDGSGGTALAIQSFGGVPSTFFIRADTTSASPSNLVTNDVVGRFGARGYINGAYTTTNLASISFTYVDSSPNYGTRIGFTTTPIGSTTAALAMSIFGDGGVIIGSGTTSPGAGLLKIESTTDATTTASGALQVPGGMSVNKRVFMNGITTSAGLQTAVICQSSGGELIADSVACLASAARFKEGFVTLTADEIRARTDRFIVKKWNYIHEDGSIFPDSYYRDRISLIADDVVKIDPRLVEYDAGGVIRTIDYNGVISLLAARVGHLGQELDELRAQRCT